MKTDAYPVRLPLDVCKRVKKVCKSSKLPFATVLKILILEALERRENLADFKAAAGIS